MNDRSLNKPSEISKCLISEVGIPTLKLSFVVIGLPEEEMMDEADSDDESAQTGMVEL